MKNKLIILAVMGMALMVARNGCSAPIINVDGSAWNFVVGDWSGSGGAGPNFLNGEPVNAGADAITLRVFGSVAPDPGQIHMSFGSQSWIPDPGNQYNLSFTMNTAVTLENSSILGVYFVSGGEMFAREWAPIPSQNTTYTVALRDFAWTAYNWGATFNITSVTEFGFYVLPPNGVAGDTTYDFSNIHLDQTIYEVPEPETVWMIMVVLASLGFTFRQRLAEVTSQVKARFVA